jgi:hypothetical protein
VYLIGPEDASPLKIGVAGNVEKRLCSLQIGNWQKLKVHHTVSVAEPLALLIERHLHGDFRDRSLRGEWFDIPLDEAVASLEAVAEAYAKARLDKTPFSVSGAINLCDCPQAARGSVTKYRNEANQIGVKTLNDRLLKRVGFAAYTVFIQTVMERRDLRLALIKTPRLYAEAEAALIKAINGLVALYAEDAEARYAATQNKIDQSRAIAA